MKEKKIKLGIFINNLLDSQALLDAGLEIATKENCPWYVIYIEDEEKTLDFLQKQYLEQSLDKAKELGAGIIRIPSLDKVQGIITAADLYSLTHIIISKNKESFWEKLIKPSLATKLQKCDLPFELNIITTEKPQDNSKLLSYKRWTSYIISVALILMLTICVEVIQESLPEYRFNSSIYNVSMIYLLVIVFCALRFGLGPAIVAAIHSFGFYNYFFIPPFYKFGLGQVSDIINLILFLSASLISVTVANVYKRNVIFLKERELVARALYNISKDITDLVSQKEVVGPLSQRLEEVLETEVSIFFSNKREDFVFSESMNISKDTVACIKQTFKQQQSKRSKNWMFYPISTPRQRLGVLGIKEMYHHSEKLVETLCYQIAIAVERMELMQESENIKIKHQRESLRSALLSSISHDLKTPLASIIGSLSSIRHLDKTLTSEERKELVSTAIEEAERLNQSITNILEMTYIESGEMKLKKEWVDIHELFMDSIQHKSNLLKDYQVTVQKPSEPITIYVDPILFIQIIYNLLENITKYTPKGSKVMLSAYIKSQAAILSISDNGPGIPPSDQEKVFDKFFRIEKRDTRRAGTGLGLAICKAIVKAHGGSIKCKNNLNKKGLCVLITIKEYKITTER